MHLRQTIDQKVRFFWYSLSLDMISYFWSNLYNVVSCQIRYYSMIQ